ncbi:ABC transporter substrate-binding protein [Spirillospora sp. CA-255316]
MPRLSPRRRPLPRILAAATAAVALFAATSCAGAGQPSASGDRTLSLAIQAVPNSFDPAQLIRNQSSFIWSAIYDTLVYLDNRGKLQPNAAESWNYSDKGRTLTLKLRPGMTFSSGAPVNASAVKATLDRTKNTPGPAREGLTGVTSIETPDDRTVILRLSQPNAALLDFLATNAGVIADPATLNAQRTSLNPVGSGPYVLDTASTVNGSTYVLNRRKDYWNAKAYPFETLKIRVMPDRTAALNALQGGELNAGTVEVSQVDRVKAAGFDDTLVQANSLGYLVLADRSGEKLKPLGDPRVRQAINMAFDRQKIVAQLLRGAGRPTQQMFNPKGAAYDPALEKTYSYDPQGAKRLLAQAGYPGGFSVTMPELFLSKPFQPTIAQSLAAIGIKVTWEPVPSQRSDSAIASKKYPMFFMVSGLQTPASDTLQTFTVDGHFNPYHSEDPDLTALLAKADQALEPQQAAAAYKQVGAYVVRNAWNAPLFYIGVHWATKKGIAYLGDGSSTFNTVRAFGVSG